jgi:hypothetical protein
VINFKWECAGYLANVIFPTFEHAHNINNLRLPVRSQWTNHAAALDAA